MMPRIQVRVALQMIQNEEGGADRVRGESQSRAQEDQDRPPVASDLVFSELDEAWFGAEPSPTPTEETEQDLLDELDDLDEIEQQGVLLHLLAAIGAASLVVGAWLARRIWDV